jgi:molybdate transport system ATP-binding protein
MVDIYPDFSMIKLKFDKKLLAPGGTLNLSIDCMINNGDFVTLYGPSGAGKTTLLRTLAGLMTPDSGLITINEQIWFDARNSINLKPQQRSIGLVFQDYALFPNMTVAENIYYAVGKDKNKPAVNDILQLMDLDDLLNRQPETLSGGQKQRVALARSLVTMPEILMLDEPMSALDLEMRQKIQDYLLLAHKKFKLTTILVSHDIGEIFKLSNSVIMIENGRITRQGTPSEIFIENRAGGNFQFAGEILNISQEEVIYIVTVLIGQQIVKIVAEESVMKELATGDKVMVTAKAFNPIIQKLI